MSAIMSVRVSLRVAFAILISGLSVGAASAAELVGPKELKTAWFDGRTVSTAGPRGGKSDFTFRPDGTLIRTGARAGSAGDGTWRLDDDGFCMTLGQAKRESCYVAIRGDGGSLRVMRRASAFTWTR